MADHLEPVDSFIFEGLQSRFLEVFNTPTVWSTSTDKVKALEKLFPDKNAKIVYPYAFLGLTSWSRSDERGSNRAASIRGTRVAISTDEKSSTTLRFMPTDFNISVEWYSNSFKDLLEFSRKWMFIRERGHLNFKIDFGQTSFDVKTVPETNITFPKREADPDNVQEYFLETSLIVHGYISENELMSTPVVDTINLTTALPEGTVLWQFKSPPNPPL